MFKLSNSSTNELDILKFNSEAQHDHTRISGLTASDLHNCEIDDTMCNPLIVNISLLCTALVIVRYPKYHLSGVQKKVSMLCQQQNKSFNPIQAGVFWSHIGWGGGTLCLSLFLIYLFSNYYQTLHDGTLAQNLSKALKDLLTSSLGGKYDLIKLFFVLFQLKIRVLLSCVQLS